MNQIEVGNKQGLVPLLKSKIEESDARFLDDLRSGDLRHRINDVATLVILPFAVPLAVHYISSGIENIQDMDSAKYMTSTSKTDFERNEYVSIADSNLNDFSNALNDATYDFCLATPLVMTTLLSSVYLANRFRQMFKFAKQDRL